MRSASWCPSVGVSSGQPDAVEEARHLGLVEPQRVRPDLDQVPAGAQPRHPQRRVRPGRDHQLDPLRAVPQELGEQRTDLGGLRAVVVVEDEHQVVVATGQRVEQPRHRDVADPAGPCPHRGHRGTGDAGLHAGQRRRDVAPEPLRLAVPGVERHPGEPAGRSVCAHSASSVVLPNPAGAETSVRLRPPPARRVSSNPGRRTEPRGRRGGTSLARTTPRSDVGRSRRACSEPMSCVTNSPQGRLIAP